MALPHHHPQKFAVFCRILLGRERQSCLNEAFVDLPLRGCHLFFVLTYSVQIIYISSTVDLLLRSHLDLCTQGRLSAQRSDTRCAAHEQPPAARARRLCLQGCRLWQGCLECVPAYMSCSSCGVVRAARCGAVGGSECFFGA